MEVENSSVRACKPYPSPLILVIHVKNIYRGGAELEYCTCVAQERTEKLTQALFSLDEPWRSRFLHLVANQATGWTWPEQVPTQAEVAAWLDDWELYKRVKSQLNVWQGKQL
jgi:hypothetical protein